MLTLPLFIKFLVSSGSNFSVKYDVYVSICTLDHTRNARCGKYWHQAPTGLVITAVHTHTLTFRLIFAPRK